MAVSPYGFQQYGGGAVRVGPGWDRKPSGSVRIGGARPIPRRPPAASANGTPPPGLYNPQREFEVEAGDERLKHAEGSDSISLARAGTDYATRLGDIERREGERRQNADRAKAAILRAFTQLGTRQGEQANRAGVLQGGALVQAASKRAANEGLQQQDTQTTLDRGLTGDREAREALALELAPPVSGSDWSQIAEGTAGAGRRIVDMARALLQSQGEQTTLRKNATTAEGAEAAQLKWDPTVPTTAPAAQRFLNRGTHRMETRAQMRARRGRRR